MSEKRRHVPRIDSLETRELLSSIVGRHGGAVEVLARKTPHPVVKGSVDGSFAVAPPAGLAFTGSGTVRPTVGTVTIGGTSNLSISTTPGSKISGSLVLVIPGSTEAGDGRLILDLSGKVPRKSTAKIPVNVKADPSSTGLPAGFLGERGNGTIRITSNNFNSSGTFTFQFTLRPRR